MASWQSGVSVTMQIGTTTPADLEILSIDYDPNIVTDSFRLLKDAGRTTNVVLGSDQTWDITFKVSKDTTFYKDLVGLVSKTLDQATLKMSWKDVSDTTAKTYTVSPMSWSITYEVDTVAEVSMTCKIYDASAITTGFTMPELGV